MAKRVVLVANTSHGWFMMAGPLTTTISSIADVRLPDAVVHRTGNILVTDIWSIQEFLVIHPPQFFATYRIVGATRHQVKADYTTHPVKYKKDPSPHKDFLPRAPMHIREHGWGLWMAALQAAACQFVYEPPVSVYDFLV